MGGRWEVQGGRGHLWLIHVDVRQKPAQCCKANILQLKKKRYGKKMRSVFKFLYLNVIK